MKDNGRLRMRSDIDLGELGEKYAGKSSSRKSLGLIDSEEDEEQINQKQNSEDDYFDDQEVKKKKKKHKKKNKFKKINK